MIEVDRLLSKIDPKSYAFGARVRPVLLASFPIAVAVVAWFPEAKSSLNWLLGAGVIAGLPFLLSERGADAGRRLEKRLWENWGGAPTTQLLRHRDDAVNPHTKRMIHDRFGRLCPHV